MFDWREYVRYACDIYGDENVETSARREVEYQIHNDGERTVVVFRGTDEPQDWLRNLDILKADVPGYGHVPVRVHRGYWEAVDSVWEKIWDRVKAAPLLIFCGHSKGGAEAMVAAFRAAEANDKVKCCNIGAPAVGNAEFGKLFRKRISAYIRYRHNMDPVSAVLTQRHGYYHVQPATSLWSFRMPWLISNHSTKHYRRLAG